MTQLPANTCIHPSMRILTCSRDDKNMYSFQTTSLPRISAMAAKISKISHPDRQQHQQQHDDQQLQHSEQQCSSPVILLEICASENRAKDLILHSLTHSLSVYLCGRCEENAWVSQPRNYYQPPVVVVVATCAVRCFPSYSSSSSSSSS